MARSFTLGRLTDDKGRVLINARCVAYRVDTHVAVETQYTDANGDAVFVALTDNVDCSINVYHHDKADPYYSEAPPDLSEIPGDLDDVDNGTTYGRVVIGDLSAGHILLDNTVAGTYGKVLSTDISAGHITLDSTVAGTYGKVLTTDISGGHVILSECSGDLDDVTDGSTYGKALLSDLSAGHLKLTSATVVSGEWYDESGVEIDAAHGINIYGTANALTTRATKTGTIQCYVGADGKLYAGAGVVQIDADGITFNDYTKKITFKSGAYQATIGSLVDGTLNLDGTGGVSLGRIYGDFLPYQDGVGNVGSTVYKWNGAYIENPRFDIVYPYGSNKQIGFAGLPWTKAIITVVEPDTTGVGNIGSSTKKYLAGHFERNFVYDYLRVVDPALFYLPVKTTTGHPTVGEGVTYVNTYDNKISCYADGAWRDLATW